VEIPFFTGRRKAVAELVADLALSRGLCR